MRITAFSSCGMTVMVDKPGARVFQVEREDYEVRILILDYSLKPREYVLLPASWCELHTPDFRFIFRIWDLICNAVQACWNFLARRR
jgi:hypothetical protein